MEGKEILHAVLAADSAAAARYAAAQKKQKALDAGGRETEKLIRQTAMEQAEKQAEAKSAALERRTAEELARIDKQTEQRLAAMDKQFDQVRSSCVERIFRETVGLA